MEAERAPTPAALDAGNKGTDGVQELRPEHVFVDMSPQQVAWVRERIAALGAVIQHCQECGYDNTTGRRRNNCPFSGGHELLDGPRPTGVPVLEGAQDASGKPVSRWRAVTTSPGCWHVARNLEKGLQYLNPDAPPMPFDAAQRAADEANRTPGMPGRDAGNTGTDVGEVPRG